jgi:PIN domain
LFRFGVEFADGQKATSLDEYWPGDPDQDPPRRPILSHHALVSWMPCAGHSDEALTRQLALIGDLYDASRGNPGYVPDTNALLHNPNLDQWKFEGFKHFTIVLTPAVLSELDRLKVEHRNPDVRGKAEALIGRIKSWRTRGDLLAGVTLRRDVSELKSIAVEPRVEEALPWLDPANADDRLIAAVIEVMRQHPRAPVILVTRDMNAQNKAAYASRSKSHRRRSPAPVSALQPREYGRGCKRDGVRHRSCGRFFRKGVRHPRCNPAACRRTSSGNPWRQQDFNPKVAGPIPARPIDEVPAASTQPTHGLPEWAGQRTGQLTPGGAAS